MRCSSPRCTRQNRSPAALVCYSAMSKMFEPLNGPCHAELIRSLKRRQSRRHHTTANYNLERGVYVRLWSHFDTADTTRTEVPYKELFYGTSIAEGSEIRRVVFGRLRVAGE